MTNDRAHNVKSTDLSLMYPIPIRLAILQKALESVKTGRLTVAVAKNARDSVLEKQFPTRSCSVPSEPGANGTAGGSAANGDEEDESPDDVAVVSSPGRTQVSVNGLYGLCSTCRQRHRREGAVSRRRRAKCRAHDLSQPRRQTHSLNCCCDFRRRRRRRR